MRRAALAFVVALGACTRPEPRAPALAPAPTQDEAEPGEEEEETEAPPASSAARAPRAPRHGQGACAPDLAGCPLDGCAAPGSPHALLNRLKRTTTTDDGAKVTWDGATPIGFSHLRRLQAHAERVLPKRADRELTEEDRRLLHKVPLGDVTIGEGDVVRLAGYIAPSGRSQTAGAHEGSVESVNCRVRAQPAIAALDFHIPVTAAARGEDECHGAVVEMIPQGRERHPAWTLANLRDLAKRRALVLFVGRLFYDSEHLVRDDCSLRGVQQPKRMTLWEVHPVVEMYVCKDDGCTAASKDGWQRVD